MSSDRKERIQEMIRADDAKKELRKPLIPVKEKVKRKPVDIQGGMRKKADSVIGMFEEKFDQYGKDFIEMDPYRFMVTEQIKPKHTKMIRDHANAHVKEYKEIITSKDEQIREGYRFWTKPQLKNMLKWWKKISDDCLRIVEDGKYARRANRAVNKRKKELAKYKKK